MRRMFSLKQLEEIANARVEALVEGGTLDNAKPLYWHGIECYRSGGNDFYFLIFIINNDNTPINSVDKLIDKIVSFGNDAYVNANGVYKLDSKDMTTLGFYWTGSKIYITGYTSVDHTYTTINKTAEEWKTTLSGASTTDRINKLN